MATIEVTTFSDDDTHLNAPCLLDAVKHLDASSRNFGKNMASVHSWKAQFEAAGFTNVKDDVMKVSN